jgi:hypothetical protein
MVQSSIRSNASECIGFPEQEQDVHENWYDRNILPYLIDFACGIKPIRRQRDKVVPLAQGRVLEVGISTGRNMPLYDRRNVQHVVDLDSALRMHPFALKRIAEARLE